MEGVRLECGCLLYGDDCFYSTFIKQNPQTKKFYVEGNDGREHWEISVTPEKLRAFADFIENLEK